MSGLYLRFRDSAGADLVTALGHQFSGLQLSSSMPGGYKELSCALPLGLIDKFYWYDRRLNWRVTCYEGPEERWDGRIEGLSIGDGALQLTARGYARACYDDYYNGTPAGGNYHADMAIIRAASCPDLKNDDTELDDPGLVGPATFANNAYPGDIFDQMVALGGTGALPWDWYVYEDKILQLHARDTDTIKWMCWFQDLAPGVNLQRALPSIWNAVSATYSDGTTRGTTGESTDTDSIAKYGLTRRRIINAGVVGAGVAQSQRDMFLAEHGDSPQESGLTITGRIYGANAGYLGSPMSLSSIKAGEILRIVDLVPLASTPTESLDALRTFFIKEASYNDDRQSLSIVPDWPMMTLAQALKEARQWTGPKVSDLAAFFRKTA